MKSTIENIKSTIAICLVTSGFLSPLASLSFLVCCPQNMTTYLLGSLSLFTACCSAWIISVFIKES
jgi:hypothetical protein